MGRASIALGAPDGGSGIMDGSGIETHLVDRSFSRSAPFGVARTGQTVSQPKATESAFRRQDAPEAEEEVVRSQLWFQLSLDERTQFGNCFSRMLLKCLSRAGQEQQEVGR